MWFTFTYGLGESWHKYLESFVVHEALYVDYCDGNVSEVPTLNNVISNALSILSGDTSGSNSEPWERLFGPL